MNVKDMMSDMLSDTLPVISFVGGYTMLYVDKDNVPLCGTCAQKRLETGASTGEQMVCEAVCYPADIVCEDCGFVIAEAEKEEEEELESESEGEN